MEQTVTKPGKVTCDETLRKLHELAQDVNLTVADLLVLENQTQTGGDMLSTGRGLVTIAQVCFEGKDWPLLVEEVLLPSRHPGQLKQAVVKMVQNVCTHIHILRTMELQSEFNITLRNATEEVIHVEVERARCTLQLAGIKEAEGNILEAANVLQELQVETYGSMEKEEVDSYLKQIRYLLAKNDYARSEIISKKIQLFDDKATQQLNIQCYALMIELHEHEGFYLSICKHYRAVLKTPSIQADEGKLKKVYRHVVLYLILSSYGNEQSDLLPRLIHDKELEKTPTYKRILELFKNQKLSNWGMLCTNFEAEFKGTYVFDQSPFGLKRWSNPKNPIIKHKIRIMAKYYSRIRLQCMSALLDLEIDEVENMLCDMVAGVSVAAKVDHTLGVVYWSIDPGKKEKFIGPLLMENESEEIVKMELDCFFTCDQGLPKLKLAKDGNMTRVLADLVLKKQIRTGFHVLSTGLGLVTIAQVCFEGKDWPLLVEHVLFLSPPRGQLKQTIVKMVQEVCTYIHTLRNKELQYEFNITRGNATEEVIHVEVERARRTVQLAGMKEAEGNILEAANVLQELQVETYGSMKKEEVDSYLEQIRYILAKNDYTRTQIIYM